MADLSNHSPKFKMTNNASFIGSLALIISFMAVLLFAYYMQFFVDVDQMGLRAQRGRYILFGREYSLQVTVLFLLLNFLIARILIFIIPGVYQSIKYKNGFIFHDNESLFFGNEKLPLKDIYKCVNDFSAGLKNPRHRFCIHNLTGESYCCHYVFKEDPKQLIAQIEALARDARAAA